MSLGFLDVYNFSATKVEVYNNESATYEIINLVTKNPKKERGALKINTDITDMINRMLLIKDKFQISDCCFRELSAICKEIP